MTLKEQIAAAVEELAAIPFFPKESGAQFAIMRAMERFVRGPRELRWLIDTAVGKMREWKGVAELRGLYCTRFSPIDGIEEDCGIPGFTANDSESGYVQVQAAETERRLLEYRHQKLLAPSSEVFDAAELPIAKRVDPAPPSRTVEGVRAQAARERLAGVMDKPVKPVSIPSTPTRTPEERERLRREMVEKLIALGWSPEQVCSGGAPNAQ